MKHNIIIFLILIFTFSIQVDLYAGRNKTRQRSKRNKDVTKSQTANPSEPPTSIRPPSIKPESISTASLLNIECRLQIQQTILEFVSMDIFVPLMERLAQDTDAIIIGSTKSPTSEKRKVLQIMKENTLNPNDPNIGKKVVEEMRDRKRFMVVIPNREERLRFIDRLRVATWAKTQRGWSVAKDKTYDEKNPHPGSPNYYATYFVVRHTPGKDRLDVVFSSDKVSDEVRDTYIFSDEADLNAQAEVQILGDGWDAIPYKFQHKQELEAKRDEFGIDNPSQEMRWKRQFFANAMRDYAFQQYFKNIKEAFSKRIISISEDGRVYGVPEPYIISPLSFVALYVNSKKVDKNKALDDFAAAMRTTRWTSPAEAEKVLNGSKKNSSPNRRFKNMDQARNYYEKVANSISNSLFETEVVEIGNSLYMVNIIPEHMRFQISKERMDMDLNHPFISAYMGKPIPKPVKVIEIPNP